MIILRDFFYGEGNVSLRVTELDHMKKYSASQTQVQPIIQNDPYKIFDTYITSMKRKVN